MIGDSLNRSIADSFYDYNRPAQDNRFKSLSRREQDDEDLEDQPKKRITLNKVISNYDRKLLEYIVNMHNILRGDHIDVNAFANVVDAIEHMKKEQDHEYLVALTRPETSKGAKIPSQIPVPSSSFQLHNSIMLTTNASGHASVIFNPFYLGSSGTNSTLFVNNNAGLTGSASSSFFQATNIGQVIPAVYNNYRVVSASIVIKYVGRLDIVQGVIGGSILFDNNISPADYSTSAINANLAKYGDFNLAMDAFYTQENLALNGLRELYFPLDNTFEQYQPLGTSKNGFGMLAYIYGGVPSSASYKVDVYVNFECLPDVTFLNYLPTSACYSSPERNKDAVQAVQQRPITDESEGRGYAKKQGGGFWDSVKNTLGSLLPSVGSIAASFFPGLKTIAPMIQARQEKKAKAIGSQQDYYDMVD